MNILTELKKKKEKELQDIEYDREAAMKSIDKMEIPNDNR